MRKSNPLGRITLHGILMVLVVWSVLPFLWTIQTSIKFTRDVAAKDPVFWGYDHVRYRRPETGRDKPLPIEGHQVLLDEEVCEIDCRADQENRADDSPDRIQLSQCPPP